MMKKLLGVIAIALSFTFLSVIATSRLSSAAPPGGLDLVYKTPVDSRTSGRLVLEARDAAGNAVGTLITLGDQVTARAVPTSSGLVTANDRNLVLVGAAVVERRNLDSLLPTSTRMQTDGTEVTLIGPDGTFYEASGLRIVAHGAARTRTYDVPAPPIGSATVDGKAIKVEIKRGAGRVGGLVIGTDGHLYAVVTNFVNSLVADLTNGRTLPLAAFGSAIGAASTSDGSLHVLGFDPSHSESAYSVLRIDLRSWSVVSTATTGILPAKGDVDDRPEIIASPKAIWVYASQVLGTDKSLHTSQLIEIPLTSYAPAPHPLAPNIGSRLTVNSGGTFIFYGGPAPNIVTKFDPGANTTQVAAYAPAGSFVVEVFAH